MSIIVLLVIGYFFRLFYPEPQLIVTPDFGRSDAWHSSIAMKFILSESLKSGTLPTWRSDLAHGTPLLAEGETGTYFLPNFLLFWLLPPVVAYNLIVILVFLTFGLGTYASLRLLGTTPLSSLFAAVTFAFSALPIVNLTHIALLQGMSMLPVIFAATVQLIRYGTTRWIGILALLITQQFFAGFPQATFLTLVLCGSYVSWIARTHKRYGRLFVFTLSVILGIVGASAQLLPSREYLSQTSNPWGFSYAIASQYSMPLKHLATFVHPFAFGNPKDGSYLPFYAFDSSIFWENTGFIGWLPLLFVLISLIRLKRRTTGFFIVLVVLGIVMAWGKYSPLYVLYSIWPLNLFRVPSRFIWLTIFGLIVLAGLGFDYGIRRSKAPMIRMLLIFGVFLSFIQLTHAFWRYHLVLPARDLIQTSSIITPPKDSIVLTMGYPQVHNREFTTNGWNNGQYYRDLYTNGFTPDANALFGISQHEVYLGRNLYRSDLSNSLIQKTLSTSERIATVSSDIAMNLLGLQTVLSFVPITSNTLALQNEEKTQAGVLRMYHNPNALPNAYIISEATTAATLTQAAERILSPDFTPGKTVLLETRDVEKNPHLARFIHPSLPTLETHTVQTTKRTHSETVLTIENLTTNSILVQTDTYYPGWVATVNGKETPIFPANITQRAIVVPKGTSEVTFKYNPASVRIGFKVSLIMECVVVLLAVIPNVSFHLGTSHSIRLPWQRRQRRI